MKIIQPDYKWAKSLTEREVTNHIVLHQRAGWGDVQGLHQFHLNKGWAGIGYHLYVRLDGTIYFGRPINCVGAQVENYNWESIGICAEGYYSEPPAGSNITPNRTMPAVQRAAIVEAVNYCRNLYPSAQIVKHGTLIATSCPGEYYPFDEIVRIATNTVMIAVRGQTFTGLLIDGVTYAPVRKVAEAVGQTVGWNPTTRTVTIS